MRWPWKRKPQPLAAWERELLLGQIKCTPFCKPVEIEPGVWECTCPEWEGK